MVKLVRKRGRCTFSLLITCGFSGFPGHLQQVFPLPSYHGHEVGHVHALQDVGQQEDHHEDMSGGESPCPPGTAAKQATAGAGLRGGAAIEV